MRRLRRRRPRADRPACPGADGDVHASRLVGRSGSRNQREAPHFRGKDAGPHDARLTRELGDDRAEDVVGVGAALKDPIDRLQGSGAHGSAAGGTGASVRVGKGRLTRRGPLARTAARARGRPPEPAPAVVRSGRSERYCGCGRQDAPSGSRVAAHSYVTLVRPMRLIRTNASISSSKRAGAWYSTLEARITNCLQARGRREVPVYSVRAWSSTGGTAVVDDALSIGVGEPDPRERGIL